MLSLTDQELLRGYSERRADDLFAEFVRRHVDLVYSSALRTLRNPHLAEDVTQSVFMAAAQNASNLGRHPTVVGWLHRATQNIAANAIREAVRRRAREQKSTAMNDSSATDDNWASIEPHLEEALASLRDPDREIVLMRFFQGMSARDIAATIGASEEAAQKRLNRAVEKLRNFFAARKIAIGATAIGFGLTANAVKAAPAGLAASIAATVGHSALANAAMATLTHGVVMTATHKTIMIASLALAMIGVSVYQTHKTQETRRLADELAVLRKAHQTALAEFQTLQTSKDPQPQTLELHHLRREVSQLRSENQKMRGTQTAIDPAEAALISWLKRAELFKQAQHRLPEKSIPELSLLTEEDWLQMAKESSDLGGIENAESDLEANRKRLNIARAKAKTKLGFLLSGALDRYRADREDQLPSDVTELQPYLRDREPHLGGSAEHVSDTMLRRYQFLRAGAFNDVPAADAIILAEIAPADVDFDTRLVIGKHWLQTAGRDDASYW